MITFPTNLNRFLSHVFHAFGITLFYIFFALFYEPRYLQSLLSVGEDFYPRENMFAFNLAITTAIVFGCMVVTRAIYHFVARRNRITYPWYAIWCLLELLVISCFTALYYTLVSPESSDYFQYLGLCFTSLTGVLIYPYIILALLYTIQELNKEKPEPEGQRLKFYDNRHLLKLITSADSILYIESNLNYINIHYLENGQVKTYSLRNTMKNIEEFCESAGIVRTHRSFLVNPRHVKMIRRDDSGFFFADLDANLPEGVPVSKSYYDKITSLL